MMIEDSPEDPLKSVGIALKYKHLFCHKKGRRKSYGRENYTILHDFSLRIFSESAKIAKI
jgi:hypothetical protein